MIAPVHRLKKKEIVWLARNRCKHGHVYLTHYDCFLKEQPLDAPHNEKIGFLDIETTGLNASFGFCLTYCIKELDGKIIKNSVTPYEVKNCKFDKRLMEDLVKDMAKFDRFVVYWGKSQRFDLPFLRTRALKWNVPFPEFGKHYVTDVFDIVKSKLRLYRRSLAIASLFFDLGRKDKPLGGDIWMKAVQGDKASLAYVLEHNVDDVILTEKLWKKLKNYMLQSNVSI